MAGKDDDIERLIAEMDALNAQAEQALTSGPSAEGKAVAKRPAAEPAPTGGHDGGIAAALVRAVVVSGVAAAVVWVVFVLLPFVGLPLGSVPAAFLAGLLVALVYSLRGRR